MRRDREGAPHGCRGRIGQALDVEKSRADDQQDASSEQHAGAEMAMVTPVRACVTDDADDGGRRDERPFETLVRKMSKPKERQNAGERRQRHTVNGARRRHDDPGAVPAATGDSRGRCDAEHPVTLFITTGPVPHFLDRQPCRRHDRFLVLYEPSWGRLESFE
jgi:hypothetical protein